jgi:hypothetical protein
LAFSAGPYAMNEVCEYTDGLYDYVVILLERRGTIDAVINYMLFKDSLLKGFRKTFDKN